MINTMKIVDVHTHGIGGYDTRTTTPHNILKIADIQGSYGVSGIVLSIYPSRISTMRRHMGVVKKAINTQRVESKASINSKLKTQNSKPSFIIGVHLEGPFLNPKKRGALDKETFIEPTEYNFEKLVEGFEDIVKIITIAPEMNG